MLYIKNARTAKLEPIELLIDGGVIVASGETVAAPDGVETLDARGLVVAPGIVDMHVHLREPGFEYKEDIATGTAAAAAGGVPTVACMPNTKPTTDSVEIVRYILERANAAGSAKVLPIAAISVGQKGGELTDFETLKAAGAAAFSDDGVPVMSRDLMREAMLEADRLGCAIISHCEDFDFGGAYPASVQDARLGADLYLTNDEESMVARDIAIALETGAAVHIAHISTATSAELVRRAKLLGARVTCETCPHYLWFDESELSRQGANAKMNPPLRTPADREALLRAICDGTVDAIATDHAPHSAEEKCRGVDAAPNGIIGLETLIGGAIGALKGRLPLAEILAKMSAGPRKILGLPAPSLEVGAAADLTIIDPDEKWTPSADSTRSRSKNSPFFGVELVGRVHHTIVAGKVVYSL